MNRVVSKSLIVLSVAFMLTLAVLSVALSTVSIDSMAGILTAALCSVLVGAVLTVKVPSNSVGPPCPRGRIGLGHPFPPLRDRPIVSRTISFLLVVGLLAAVFVGVVTLVGSLLRTDSDPAVAVSTLAVAALFNPVRKRVQDWVNRRFNRSRYDAQKVIHRPAAVAVWARE